MSQHLTFFRAAILLLAFLAFESSAEARRRPRAAFRVPSASVPTLACCQPPCDRATSACSNCLPVTGARTGTPPLCPNDSSVIGSVSIYPERISSSRVTWYAINDRDKKVRIYPLATTYQNGQVSDESCWPYLDVNARTDRVRVGETQWRESNPLRDGTGIRVYHSVEIP